MITMVAVNTMDIPSLKTKAALTASVKMFGFIYFLPVRQWAEWHFRFGQTFGAGTRGSQIQPHRLHWNAYRILFGLCRFGFSFNMLIIIKLLKQDCNIFV